MSNIAPSTVVVAVGVYVDAGFLLALIMNTLDLTVQIARPGVIYVVRFYELLGISVPPALLRTLAATFMNRVTCVYRTVTVQITTVGVTFTRFISI